LKLLSPNMEITLKLNEQEANNIIQLLDIAVKAGGLANAAAALPIVEKIKQAAQPKSE
jgi:hypothetical protein